MENKDIIGFLENERMLKIFMIVGYQLRCEAMSEKSINRRKREGVGEKNGEIFV